MANIEKFRGFNGMWYWKLQTFFQYPLNRIFGRTINEQKLIEQFVAGHFNAIIGKIAQDQRPTYIPDKRLNITPKLIDTAKAQGLLVLGYTFNSLSNPSKEARVAALIAKKNQLDGIVVDLEKPAELKWLTARRRKIPIADQFVDEFRQVAPEIPLFACLYPHMYSLRNGTQIHPVDFYTQLTDGKSGGVDGVMPMAYNRNQNKKTEKSNALNQLQASIDQFRQITQKPILPILRAFQGEFGTTSTETINAQLELLSQLAATDSGIIGHSFWLMEKAIDPRTKIWECFKASNP